MLVAVALSLVVTGCGSTAGTVTSGTGVVGMVTIGPTCPVERINSPCPPRPIAATVIVRDASGTEVTRFVSAPDGSFKIQLKPGRYTLVGASHDSSGLPRPIPVSVVVAAGSFATANVQFDSGIR